ncbi:MAG: hypothetical protein SW019_25780 [Actinomycetota bacterium]|nr:hypothetical protein [Actinomycetota bacterium]
MDNARQQAAKGALATESRIPVLIALVAAMTLQLAIPKDYTLIPRWPLIVMEAILLVVMALTNPDRATRATRIGTYATFALLTAITVDNTASAVVLDIRILSGQVSNDAAGLLGSGAAIYLTNIVVFGIWFWKLDSGGPVARSRGERRYPDFMFPQMGNPELAPPDWRPAFVDYVYLSITNVMAFSPTDTMPLARWAKVMMSLQAMVALSTAALVIARAVGVLG